MNLTQLDVPCVRDDKIPSRDTIEVERERDGGGAAAAAVPVFHVIYLPYMPYGMCMHARMLYAMHTWTYDSVSFSISIE